MIFGMLIVAEIMAILASVLAYTLGAGVIGALASYVVVGAVVLLLIGAAIHIKSVYHS